MTKMDKQRFTVKEAAEALGISEKTVRRRIKDGTLKAEQVQGKRGLEYQITDLEGDQSTSSELGAEGGMALVKAIEVIKSLQEENERLAGQVGYLQAQNLELNNKIGLLTEGKQQKPLWRRLLWWRTKKEGDI